MRNKSVRPDKSDVFFQNTIILYISEHFCTTLYMGFRATLNLRKFKVALNPMNRIFLNFAKSCISSCLSLFCNKKKFHHAVFEKLKLKVFLAGHGVAMVT